MYMTDSADYRQCKSPQMLIRILMELWELFKLIINAILMKTNIFYLTILIMLFSCSKEQSVKTPISILVIPSDNSIFENRDARFLIINDSNGKKVDKVRLRDNVDSEAKAFLFRPTNNYVLIDCDGVWYYINYKTGIISKIKIMILG